MDHVILEEVKYCDMFLMILLTPSRWIVPQNWPRPLPPQSSPKSHLTVIILIASVGLYTNSCHCCPTCLLLSPHWKVNKIFGTSSVTVFDDPSFGKLLHFCRIPKLLYIYTWPEPVSWVYMMFADEEMWTNVSIDNRCGKLYIRGIWCITWWKQRINNFPLG